MNKPVKKLLIGKNRMKLLSKIAKSVAQIQIGRISATGFLISGDYLMTNQHVLRDKAYARKTKVFFGDQEGIVDEYECDLDYDWLFRFSPETKLDYAIVRLKWKDDRPAGAIWNHLRLEPIDVKINERVNVIQYPSTLEGRVVDVSDPLRIKYRTDAEVRSGSPVFNDKWQVVALHHATIRDETANAPDVLNEGIAISAIRGHLGEQYYIYTGNIKAVIGKDNRIPLSKFKKPPSVAKSVARILIDKIPATGFLIAPDCLMTNQHVLPSKDRALKARVFFSYPKGIEDEYECDPDSLYKFSPKAELDYAVVRLKKKNGRTAGQKWSYFKLKPIGVKVNEKVSIIQYPFTGRGTPSEQVAMDDNEVVDVSDPLKIKYRTDTSTGSSGSPVFNDKWQVVALHHATTLDETGESPSVINEGILISAILDHLGPLYPKLIANG